MVEPSDAAARVPELPEAVIRGAVVELTALAQSGLSYDANEFDRARYELVAGVAERLRALITAGPLAQLKPLLDRDGGHATPKVDVRTAVFDARGRLLFVRERADGRWTLPGGWCDPLDAPSVSALREVSEEAGVEARLLRLVAVLDRDVQGHLPQLPVTAYKLFFLGELVDAGDVISGTRDAKEILEVNWFDPEQLPPLSQARTTAEEIGLCVASWRDPSLPTVFD